MSVCHLNNIKLIAVNLAHWVWPTRSLSGPNRVLFGSSIHGLRLSWPLLTRLSAVCFYQRRPQQPQRQCEAQIEASIASEPLPLPEPEPDPKATGT